LFSYTFPFQPHFFHSGPLFSVTFALRSFNFYSSNRQSSPSCPWANGHPKTLKMIVVATVGPRRCLGPGAMHRIAPTIGQAAIIRAEDHGVVHEASAVMAKTARRHLIGYHTELRMSRAFFSCLKRRVVSMHPDDYGRTHPSSCPIIANNIG